MDCIDINIFTPEEIKILETMKNNYNKEHKLSKEEWIFIRQKVGAIGSLLTGYLNKKK